MWHGFGKHTVSFPCDFHFCMFCLLYQEKSTHKLQQIFWSDKCTLKQQQQWNDCLFLQDVNCNRFPIHNTSSGVNGGFYSRARSTISGTETQRIMAAPDWTLTNFLYSLSRIWLFYSDDLTWLECRVNSTFIWTSTCSFFKKIIKSGTTLNSTCHSCS